MTAVEASVPSPPLRAGSLFEPAAGGDSFRPWRVAAFGLQCLIGNARRTSLALAGVAVGLAAVVGLSLVARSAERLVLESFAGVPLELIAAEVPLEPGNGGGNSAPTSAAPAGGSHPAAPAVRSASQWVALLADRAEAAGIASRRAWNVELGNCAVSMPTQNERDSVIAAEPGLLQALGGRIAIGRDLHALDAAQPWVLLGSGIADRWRAQGAALAPGQALLVCGNTVYVAGVLAPIGPGTELLGTGLDDAVIMRPAVLRQIGARSQKVLRFWQLADEGRVAAGVAALTEMLRPLSAANGVVPSVRSAAAMVALKREQVSQNARLAALLSGISLVVGGFGIMNVMLVSGLERRYDIAVCMALGADRLAICWQFVVESTLLGLVGGALGVVVGFGLGYVVLCWLGMPWQPDYAGAGLALLLGAALGAASGLYPAIKVSRLDPAEVLAS